MELSIVIPIYKIRDYVVKCVESCIDNDVINDYEIILVDDESPDDSIDLLQPYIQKYDNISLVQRKNGGLSSARNSGLDVAKGYYVWFVDGDDYIEPDAIKIVLQTIKEHKCDIYLLGYNSVVDDKIVDSTIFKVGEGIVNPHKEFLKCNFSFPALVWTHVYNRQYLVDNNLRSYEGIIYDDTEFRFNSYYLASTLFSIEKSLYNYRIGRPGSIMTTSEKKLKEGISSRILAINKFLLDCTKYSVPTNVKDEYLSDLSLLSIELIFEQKTEIIKQHKQIIKNLLPYLVKTRNKKRKIFSRLCAILPNIIFKYLLSFYKKHLIKS